MPRNDAESADSLAVPLRLSRVRLEFQRVHRLTGCQALLMQALALGQTFRCRCLSGFSDLLPVHSALPTGK